MTLTLWCMMMMLRWGASPWATAPLLGGGMCDGAPACTGRRHQRSATSKLNFENRLPEIGSDALQNKPLTVLTV